MCDASVYVNENGLKKPYEDYFNEMDDNMSFAKWFRPFLILASSFCIYFLTVPFFLLSPSAQPLIFHYLPLVDTLSTPQYFNSAALAWITFSCLLSTVTYLMLVAVAWINVCFWYGSTALVLCTVSVAFVFV